VEHARPERFAVFRRTEVRPVPSWTEQPFVARRSRTGETSERGRRALEMLRRGDLRSLATKSRRLVASGELPRIARRAVADLRARRSV
jgi:hypothetical protein